MENGQEEVLSLLVTAILMKAYENLAPMHGAYPPQREVEYELASIMRGMVT